MPTALLSTRSLARTTPVLDFLAPRTIVTSRHHQLAHLHSSPAPSPPSPQTPPPTTSPTHNGPASTSPRRPLTPSQQAFLSSALRVNQAGELAAVLIYTSQTPPLLRAHPHLRPLLNHMHDQEAGHLKYFNALLAKHRVRPTAMYPIWHAAASFLGWSTAVMGREAAMACTEAVETEIGSHYNEQVRVLLDWAEKWEERGEGVSDEFRGLVAELRRIRDEELEHLDHAVENDAKGARPYELLTSVIRGGCRAAIRISEKI